MLLNASTKKYYSLLILVIFTAAASIMMMKHAASKNNLNSIAMGAFFAQINASGMKIRPFSASTYPNRSNSVTAANVAAVDAANAPIGKASSKAEVQAIAVQSELNTYVLRVINSYNGGRYPYLLNNDYANYNGVTENIVYKGYLVARANLNGSKSSHCVGLTYEVFFKAMRERNKEAGLSPDNFNNMSINNMMDFMMTWYAALGTPKSSGNQLAGAIVKYGLGIQIFRLEDAKAGDFIDFSRPNSGHTAVFINWLKDQNGTILGFRYWSTQESTHGIGYKVEYFSDNPHGAFKGSVNRKQLYIGRVGSINSFRYFKG